MIHILLAFLLCPPAMASIREFDSAAKAIYLNLSQQPVQYRVKAEGQFPSARHQAFYEFFENRIAPAHAEVQTISRNYGLYMVLIVAGAYKDKDEENFLIRERDKAFNQDAGWTVSAEYTEMVRQWADLAHGLSGQLPEYARSLHRQRQIQQFPASSQAQLEEAQKLANDFQTAIDQSPLSGQMTPYVNARDRVVQAFKTGEIDFETARARQAEIFANSAAARLGHDVILKAGDGLNRMAVIKSELAHVKGFKSWAQYKMAVSDEGFTPEFRGVEAKVKLLKDMAAVIAPKLDELNKANLARLRESDAYASLTSQDVNLIGLSDTKQLNAYFPPSAIRRVLSETLREAGFAEENLARIVVDDKDRPNRNNTMGFMAAMNPPVPDMMVINAATLDIERSAKWTTGEMYILQNYSDDGIDSLYTALHEIGHGFDYLLNNTELPVPLVYAHYEIASMANEHYLIDPIYLWNKMTPIDGHKPSFETVKNLARNFSLEKIREFQRLIQGSLYDIYLWDVDYSAPGAPTLIQQAAIAERRARIDVGALTDGLTNLPSYYSKFTTSHYISGEVFYYGYVLAEIAARMAADHVTDELERRTGHRTWYNQPDLSKIFVKDVVEKIRGAAFPKVIETITNRAFNPEEFVRRLAAQVDKACEEILNNN